MQKRLELRRNTFSQRIVRDWNQLSGETVSATTLTMFKTMLANEWQAWSLKGNETRSEY